MAFIHWIIASLDSAAKKYVLMFLCSALKANFLLIPSSLDAGLILYEGKGIEPEGLSSGLL